MLFNGPDNPTSQLVIEFNVPFQHKYGYIRYTRSGVESYQCPEVTTGQAVRVTAAETTNAFQWFRKSHKIAASRGVSRLPPNTCIWLLRSKSKWVSPHMTNRSVQPVLHSISMWPTHGHTDHATCYICSNRPHLMKIPASVWRQHIKLLIRSTGGAEKGNYIFRSQITSQKASITFTFLFFSWKISNWSLENFQNCPFLRVASGMPLIHYCWFRLIGGRVLVTPTSEHFH